MTVTGKHVFRLPPAASNPRRVSREQLRKLVTEERGEPEEEVVRPLDVWTHGFSANAAIEAVAEFAPMADQPVEAPSTPGRVTDLSNEDLGMLHAQFAAFAEYLEPQVALMEIQAAEDESFLAHITAEIRLVKSGTVADKNAKAINDPKYIEAEQRQLVSTAKAKLLKARFNGYVRITSALSREISRRTGEYSHGG